LHNATDQPIILYLSYRHQQQQQWKQKQEVRTDEVHTDGSSYHYPETGYNEVERPNFKHADQMKNYRSAEGSTLQLNLSRARQKSNPYPNPYPDQNVNPNSIPDQQKNRQKERPPYSEGPLTQEQAESKIIELERIARSANTKDIEHQYFLRQQREQQEKVEEGEGNESYHESNRAQNLSRQQSGSLRSARHHSLIGSSSMSTLQEKESLLSKISAFENQVKTLQTVIERKDKEQGKTEDKLHRIANELEANKKLLVTDRTSFKVSHERALLLLKEQHLKDMTEMASSLSSVNSQIVSDEASGVSESNRRLLSQLEVMRAEQRRVQDQFLEERKGFQAESSARLMNQERDFKVEVSDFKRQKASLEDRLTILTDDLSSMNAKADSLRQLCRQLEQSRDEALDSQQRLRGELKTLQAGVAASARLDGPGSGTVTAALNGDPESAWRLNEAKADAKLRQLTNKLDFLKAQLSSEQASAEDLKSAAERNRSKVDELKGEFRLKTQEMERVKDQAVEDAEKRLEVVYEDRMVQYTTLQAKSMSLHGQLQDAYQDAALAKQREESARVEKSRSNAHQIALKTEIESLKSMLQSLRDEREQEATRNGTKHSQDATVRRLDNERQYLKSQLGSEITLKNELHEALFQCQYQLGDTQTQWKSDVEALKVSPYPK
jgi:DNA repair exonuclease SbcCD ATPase subunit